MSDETASSPPRASSPSDGGVSGPLLLFTRLLAWFCWAGVVFTVAILLATVFGVLNFNEGGPHSGSSGLLGSSITVGEEGLSEREAGFYRNPLFLIALAVSTAIYVWALISAARSLFAVGRGAFFSHDAIAGLRNLALAVFLHMVVAPLVMLAARIGFIAQRDHGSLEITAGLSSQSILMLVFAGAVAVISGVMAHAARIAAENEQFV